MVGYFVGTYLVVSILAGIFFWSALVVAKRSDRPRYAEDKLDIPEDNKVHLKRPIQSVDA